MFASVEFLLSPGLGCRSSFREARWVRKWIKRQQAKTRGRKSDGSNSGSASTNSTNSPTADTDRPASSEEMPQSQGAPNCLLQHEHMPVALPTCSVRAPVPLVFPPAVQSDPLCSPNFTAARPAAFVPVHASGTSGSQQLCEPCSLGAGEGLSSGTAYNCVAGPSSAAMYLPPLVAPPKDPLTAPIELSAASFSPQLCPGTPSSYTGALLYDQDSTAFDMSPSPDVAHFDPAYTRTAAGIPSSVGLPPAAVFPGVPDTIAPAALSVPTFVPPTELTASAAYLYEIFHDAPAAAPPPEAPPFSSVFFLPGLTRPSDLRAPLSDFASTPQLVSHSGYIGAAYPLSYQMRLSDLMALTRAIRLAGASSDQTQAQDTTTATGAGVDESIEHESEPCAESARRTDR